MAQYKVIAGPKKLTIGHDGNMSDAMEQYQSIIQKEAQGGWELVCINSVEITQNPEPLPPLGCLLSLLCALKLMTRPVEPPPIRSNVNMLVFVQKG
ncbi:MAG: DUF4177 domain-containing protein [Fibromonadales bacterium]|nr:DUF4177 domain-containing protein [Fibromonadales bacterium]